MPAFEIVLRLADDHLILGHRVSEWCGHAPMLEEDLALPNIALDLLGQARALYSHAGTLEGKGRDEDALAYLRLEGEYRNLLMLERPNGDFAHTILRQFYFSAFMVPLWERAASSSDTTLAAIAAKAVKEARYHLRHTAEWVIRLGDGTAESHRRMCAAIADLAPYTGEMFVMDTITQTGVAAGLIPAFDTLHPIWSQTVMSVFAEATLPVPPAGFVQTGGRRGRHTEDIGFILADLQYVQRTYPNMAW
jgi:ring-1,2-phenylacetyl-CoA epoxidase subunit PaaC